MLSICCNTDLAFSSMAPPFQGRPPRQGKSDWQKGPVIFYHITQRARPVAEERTDEKRNANEYWNTGTDDLPSLREQCIIHHRA